MLNDAKGMGERLYLSGLDHKNGEELKEKAAEVSAQTARSFYLDAEEAETLYRILYKILDDMKEV